MRKARNDLTADFVRSIFDYNPESGALSWKKDVNKIVRYNTRPGCIAGSKNVHGYMWVQINKKRYYVHRIIYLYTHGIWPLNTDHARGQRADNRIALIREADNSQNVFNRGKQSNNTSGYKGVTFHKQSGRWRAQIMTRGKYKCLKLHDTPEKAYAAYCEAAKLLHGEFARL